VLSLFEYLCHPENSLPAGKRCEKTENAGENFRLAELLPDMPERCTRTLVRVLIGTALCAAIVASAVVPVPEDLPAVALRQPSLYRLEVALLVFYGALLLITPAFSGLIRGRLPIEISTRGARFAVEADQSTESNEAAIRKLEQIASSLTDDLTEAKAEIEELKEQVTVSDRQ
jgi:hypothetical protein